MLAISKFFRQSGYRLVVIRSRRSSAIGLDVISRRTHGDTRVGMQIEQKRYFLVIHFFISLLSPSSLYSRLSLQSASIMHSHGTTNGTVKVVNVASNIYCHGCITGELSHRRLIERARKRRSPLVNVADKFARCICKSPSRNTLFHDVYKFQLHTRFFTLSSLVVLRRVPSSSYALQSRNTCECLCQILGSEKYRNKTSRFMNNTPKNLPFLEKNI